MAIDWKGIIGGAIRGGAPDIAESFDRKRGLDQRQQDLDSLIKGREFQNVLNMARQVSQRGQNRTNRQTRRRDKEAWGLMSDEEKVASKVYSRSRTAPKTPLSEADQRVKAAEDLAKIEKAEQAGLLSDSPERAKFFEDSKAEILNKYKGDDKPPEVEVDAVTGADAPTGGRGFFGSVADVAGNILGNESLNRPFPTSARPAPAAQRPAPTDNRGLFSPGPGQVNPFEPIAPRAAPAPMTFADMGIGDAQTQQVFSELESRIPSLRQDFGADPETFMLILDALKKGKLTIDDAISIIEESKFGSLEANKL